MSTSIQGAGSIRPVVLSETLCTCCAGVPGRRYPGVAYDATGSASAG